MFLLPLAHVANRCPAASPRSLLLGSLALFSLITGLAALCRDGIVLDVVLGLAGILAAAQTPVMSSLLASVYSAPSTRRQCVFTFFEAGANSIAVVFGSLGSGLVATLTRDWRASFVYIAVLLAIVLSVAIFAIPSTPEVGPYSASMARHHEEQNALLGSEVRGTVEKRGIRED